jgi:hypothetical protein
VIIRNTTGRNFKYVDQKQDSGSYLIDLGKIDLASGKADSMIEDVLLDNFKPGLLKFGGFTGKITDGKSKKFKIRKIAFKQSVYETKTTPLWIFPFETTEDVTVQFEACKFENIEL